MVVVVVVIEAAEEEEKEEKDDPGEVVVRIKPFWPCLVAASSL